MNLLFTTSLGTFKVNGDSLEVISAPAGYEYLLGCSTEMTDGGYARFIIYKPGGEGMEFNEFNVNLERV